jgi:hypothetical protein
MQRNMMDTGYTRHDDVMFIFTLTIRGSVKHAAIIFVFTILHFSLHYDKAIDRQSK